MGPVGMLANGLCTAVACMGPRYTIKRQGKIGELILFFEGRIPLVMPESESRLESIVRLQSLDCSPSRWTAESSAMPKIVAEQLSDILIVTAGVELN